jgi:RHS repeat-associated protein
VSDTRGAGPAMSFEYDVEGRLAHAFQTATPAEGGTYAYDSRWRLASRTVSHASPASSAAILYLHDLDDHIIAETDTSGNTLREYVWMGDTPLAVVDNVPTSPAIFYVHTDHLMRPLRMTDASAALAWEAAYDPFGAVASVNAISSNIDLRFPGQWFQLESAPHYNWHRPYDASLGRYLQPDPLLVDDTQPATIFGIERGILMARNDSFGALNDWQQIKAKMVPTSDVQTSGQGAKYARLRTMMPDGPNPYGYARQSPVVQTDPSGLAVGGFTPGPQTSNITQCLVAANDNMLGNWCFGSVASIDKWSVVTCSYVCSNGMKFTNTWGSWSNGLPFCPRLPL